MGESTSTQIVGQHYKIIKLIGKGEFGKVFKGEDTRTGQVIAIKEVPINSGDKQFMAEELTRVMREAELMKLLQHPNVVRYFDFVNEQTSLYIILEFMDSGSLGGYIKSFSDSGVTEEAAKVYIAQVLSGLNYLHSHQILHRDIKADNILIDKKGECKLADFGVAKQLKDGATKAYTFCGTTCFLAPEILLGEGQGLASDIWAVGCTLIELLTGKAPYQDVPMVSVWMRITEDPHPPLPDNISATFKEFLLLCFEKDPEKRSSAAALLQHPAIADTVADLEKHGARSL